ncbi:MAG: hypothetical protein RL095_403 [Verrucomicrobiota bacterium]|jgi:uncharacterized protein (TIGR00251 family)
MPALEPSDKGLKLHLHVQPGARCYQVDGLHGEAIKVKIAAPPVDGKANAALLSWVAELFSVSRSQVQLLSGESSRRKTLLLTGGDKAQQALWQAHGMKLIGGLP